jgi:hypothetical protein
MKEVYGLAWLVFHKCLVLTFFILIPEADSTGIRSLKITKTLEIQYSG